MNRTHDHRRIILGIGTGRCGTRSLARLLDRQPGTDVTHEDPPVLPWEMDAVLLDTRLARLLARPAPVVGDVASSWLPYLPGLLRANPDIRVIALWRDRAATITSFRNKMKGRYNHWMEHDGRRWRHNPRWDPCFPKYPVDDLETAIGRYWDDYQAGVDRLCADFPGRVRRWTVEDALNTRQGILEILDFAGIDATGRVATPGIRENRGRTARTSLLRRLGRRLGIS